MIERIFLGNSNKILAESIDDDQKQNKQTQVKPNQWLVYIIIWIESEQTDKQKSTDTHKQINKLIDIGFKWDEMNFEDTNKNENPDVWDIFVTTSCIDYAYVWTPNFDSMIFKTSEIATKARQPK